MHLRRGNRCPGRRPAHIANRSACCRARLAYPGNLFFTGPTETPAHSRPRPAFCRQLKHDRVFLHVRLPRKCDCGKGWLHATRNLFRLSVGRRREGFASNIGDRNRLVLRGHGGGAVDRLFRRRLCQRGRPARPAELVSSGSACSSPSAPSRSGCSTRPSVRSPTPTTGSTPPSTTCRRPVPVRLEQAHRRCEPEVHRDVWTVSGRGEAGAAL